MTRPRATRARLALAAVLLAVVAGVAAAVAVTGGPSEPAPATGAAAVVPADALAYVHLSTDGSRPAVKRALALAAQFPDLPLLAERLASRLRLIAPGGALSFAAGVRPWLGKEAAVALLNTAASTAAALVVLDVAHTAEAHAFLARAGIARAGAYRGVSLFGKPTGTELAFVSHYLVVGQDASVRAAIDVTNGRAPSLAANQAYQRAAATEPDGRVLDAYASAVGVRRLLIDRGGLLGALGVLLYNPALSGVALSLDATPPGAQLTIHTVLDPGLVQIGSRASAASFTPTLAGHLPASSTLALDVTDLARVAPRVLDAGATAGIAGGIGPLLSRLGAALRAQGVNVTQIEQLFSGETAIALAGGVGSGSNGGAPALVIVARTRNQAATVSELAQLEVPLAQLLSSVSSSANPGVIPSFTQRQIDGVTAHQLPIAPGLELDYAVFRGLVVVSTSLGGIGAVASTRDTLAASPAYRATLSARPSRVTSLLFLDFSQLLSLGEQTGLTRGAAFRALQADLAKVRAVGLVSTGGENDSTAELTLQIK
ncbi:MAG TPA: DUF3352 domain-containing protein [Solirubrobacteraceae bacterium]|nr:DUF3352 domain-containing protein [Solirubrobacteraceae bacterium]